MILFWLWVVVFFIFPIYPLQLNGSFSFNTYVSAVTLDTTGGQSEGDYFTVTGWGLTSVSKVAYKKNSIFFVQFP